MSIEESDSIDAIGVETASGKVILSIADHLNWTEAGAHLLALQEKLNAYVRFIESGELVSAYPDAAGRQPVIDVVTRVEIPRIGAEFLDRVRFILADSGIGLRTQVLPP